MMALFKESSPEHNFSLQTKELWVMRFSSTYRKVSVHTTANSQQPLSHSVQSMQQPLVAISFCSELDPKLGENIFCAFWGGGWGVGVEKAVEEQFTVYYEILIKGNSYSKKRRKRWGWKKYSKLLIFFHFCFVFLYSDFDSSTTFLLHNIFGIICTIIYARISKNNYEREIG